MKASTRWLALAAIIATLGLMSLVVRDAIDLEWSVASLRQFVDRAGWWAPALYVGILTFRFAVLVPSSILLTGAGVCFGAVQGTLWATIGLTLSALLKWLVASVAGRDVLLRQLPPAWRQRVTVADRRLGVGGLALICAYPLGPKHVFQIAAIFSGISLAHYTIAVATGAAFRAAVFSAFGEAVASGRGIAVATATLLVSIAVPLAIPRSRRWLLGGGEERG